MRRWSGIALHTAPAEDMVLRVNSGRSTVLHSIHSHMQAGIYHSVYLGPSEAYREGNAGWHEEALALALLLLT